MRIQITPAGVASALIHLSSPFLAAASSTSTKEKNCRLKGSRPKVAFCVHFESYKKPIVGMRRIEREIFFFSKTRYISFHRLDENGLQHIRHSDTPDHCGKADLCLSSAG